MKKTKRPEPVHPVTAFIEALDKSIAAEYDRVGRILDYNPEAKGTTEWREPPEAEGTKTSDGQPVPACLNARARLGEERDRQLQTLWEAGSAAVRAVPPHEAKAVQDLVRQVMDRVQELHGWVDAWWKEQGAAEEQGKLGPCWFGVYRGRPDVELGARYKDDAAAMVGAAARPIIGLANELRYLLDRIGPGGGAAAATVKGTPGGRKGRPPKGETDKDTLVIAALAKHHQWEPGGSVGNPHAAALELLAELASDEQVTVSKSTVSRFLRKRFAGRGLQGHKGYEADCRKGLIGVRLSTWQGDTLEGAYGLLSDEREDTD